MIKNRWLFLTLLLLLLLCAPALAAPALDLGPQCQLSYEDSRLACGYLTDHNYLNGDNLASRTEHIFYITPGRTSVAQIEVFFGTHMLPYRVERQEGDGWTVAARAAEARAQSYVRFEPIAERFRIVFSDGQRSPLTLKEILLFSEGETADTALRPWQEPCEKADIMTLVAHPDDELLWFGGLLPTYAGELQLQVQAVYMTCENALRRQELLNGLWHCGVRNYPLLCGLKDVRYSAVSAAYQCWGRETTYQTIVRAIRRFRPEVLVTHDILGEYGHTQHIVTSDAAYQAVLLAADPAYDPDSAQQYGAWQVKKLYRHLGDAPTTRMDWQQPLAAFDGQTGLEIAAQAFKLHASQQDILWPTPPGPGEQYDSTAFTLVFSAVGEDTQGNDLLENIPAEALAGAAK